MGNENEFVIDGKRSLAGTIGRYAGRGMFGTILGVSGLGVIVVLSQGISGVVDCVSNKIEEGARFRREYEDVQSDLFGSGYAFPLADTNKDDVISFNEQTEAWNRMGYRGPFYESKGEKQFPKPTIKQLRKARSSYFEESLRESLAFEISRERGWDELSEDEKRDFWEEKLRERYFDKIVEKDLNSANSDRLKRYVSELIEEKGE